MQGKHILITGATSGIGEATALNLARRGAQTIIVGRSKEKCHLTVERIKHETGNIKVSYLIADLSKMADVHALTNDYATQFPRLDVLINNAGVMTTKRQETADGFEMIFAVNYLAPFLLTTLLLDLLKTSAPSRIINVASSTHKNGHLTFNDLQLEDNWTFSKAYANAKLGTVLFTYELARRLEGTGVTVNCLHPGAVKTNFIRDLPWLLRSVIGLFLASPQKGAETSVYLASSPEVTNQSGNYFVKKNAVESSKSSYDTDLAERLWRETEALLAQYRKNKS